MAVVAIVKALQVTYSSR